MSETEWLPWLDQKCVLNKHYMSLVTQAAAQCVFHVAHAAAHGTQGHVGLTNCMKNIFGICDIQMDSIKSSFFATIKPKQPLKLKVRIDMMKKLVVVFQVSPESGYLVTAETIYKKTRVSLPEGHIIRTPLALPTAAACSADSFSLIP